MGIYIKGMEMPTSCRECPLEQGDSGYRWCGAIQKVKSTWDYREYLPDWCPLVPVPDHGRLGDLDALYKKMEHYSDNEGATGYQDDTFICRDSVLFAIEDAPTIIPASEYVTPPQTRGGSIRAKSDEKLANFLVECCGCPPDLVDREYCGAVGCSKCWLNWLQKEEKINDG